MTGLTPATRDDPGATPGPPQPQDAARVIWVLRDHPSWSVFWDKRFGVWRVADDDPDSGLYAASSDASTVIAYIQANS
jgi:hypothetical protein